MRQRGWFFSLLGIALAGYVAVDYAKRGLESKQRPRPRLAPQLLATAEAWEAGTGGTTSTRSARTIDASGGLRATVPAARAVERVVEPVKPIVAPARNLGGAPPVPSVAPPVEAVRNVGEPAAVPVKKWVVRNPPLRAWTQPGLCSEKAGDAEGVRRTLMSRFRAWDGGEHGRFFLDPRLPEGAEDGVAQQVDRAAQAIALRLKLESKRPDTFVYQDGELLRASACVNDAVVAYYDGVLHVIASDPELADSVTHELAHHALMTFGMRGPAWAQEGIAMHAALERWWLEPQWLPRLSREALSFEQMEEVIPYKLPDEQAVLFYVQAAAMVACALERKHIDLHGLAEILRDSPASVGDVRELAEPALLEACVRAGSR